MYYLVLLKHVCQKLNPIQQKGTDSPSIILLNGATEKYGPGPKLSLFSHQKSTEASEHLEAFVGT